MDGDKLYAPSILRGQALEDRQLGVAFVTATVHKYDHRKRAAGLNCFRLEIDIVRFDNRQASRRSLRLNDHRLAGTAHVMHGQCHWPEGHHQHDDAHEQVRQVGTKREGLRSLQLVVSLIGVQPGEPEPEGDLQPGKPAAQVQRVEHESHAAQHADVGPVPPGLVVRQLTTPGERSGSEPDGAGGQGNRPENSRQLERSRRQRASHGQHADTVTDFVLPVMVAVSFLDGGNGEEAVEIEASTSEEDGSKREYEPFGRHETAGIGGVMHGKAPFENLPLRKSLDADHTRHVRLQDGGFESVSNSDC